MTSAAKASFFDKFHNVIGRAFQNPAQFFQRVHRYAFVPLQIGDGICAETHFVNQCVLGNALFSHGFPQRVIADHIRTPLSDR